MKCLSIDIHYTTHISILSMITISDFHVCVFMCLALNNIYNTTIFIHYSFHRIKLDLISSCIIVFINNYTIKSVLLYIYI